MTASKKHIIHHAFGKKLFRRIPGKYQSTVGTFIYLIVQPDLRCLGKHIMQHAQIFPAFIGKKGRPQITGEHDRSNERIARTYFRELTLHAYTGKGRMCHILVKAGLYVSQMGKKSFFFRTVNIYQ